MVEITTLVVGEFAANCYIVSVKETNEAVVIDPGGEGERILEELNTNNLAVKYIINTHGHIDHIEANSLVSKTTGAQILIHKDDAPYLTDPALNQVFPFGKCDMAPPDRLLEDGEILQMGDLTLEVIHTPGHTPGGITLSLVRPEQDNTRCLFTGDTLFNGGIGRTDLPGGSYQRLMDSITKRLLSLSDETIIYPGHGPASTIGEERRGNPFLVGF